MSDSILSEQTLSQAQDALLGNHQSKHSTADDYEHFLSYMYGSGVRHSAFLCQAYFDGASAPHEEYEAYMAVHPAESVNLSEMLEDAYWEFDAREKGYGRWKLNRQSGRDAFKQTVAAILAVVRMGVA